MNFQDWLAANAKRLREHLSQGGMLQDIIQYDPQRGGFQDPLSGQFISAQSNQIQSLLGNLGAMGMKGNYLRTGDAPAYSEGLRPDQRGDAPIGPSGASGVGPGISSWSFMEDPEARASFIQLLGQLGTQAANDTEIQRAMMDWYQKQHEDMQGRQGYMDQVAGDVLGYRKRGDRWTPSGESFDPDNPQAFSGIAPEVQGISQDLTAQLKQLDESGVDPATKARMREQLMNQAYSAKVGARQGQIGKMRDYMLGQLTDARNTQAAPLTGAAGVGGGLLNQRYATKSGNSLSSWATGQQLGESAAERALRERLGLADLDFRNRQLAQDADQFKQNLALQQQQMRPRGGGLGSLLGGLLSVASFIPGPHQPFTAGAGALTGLFNKGPKVPFNPGGGGAPKVGRV